jgi:hypothetical protein
MSSAEGVGVPPAGRPFCGTLSGGRSGNFGEPRPNDGNDRWSATLEHDATSDRLHGASKRLMSNLGVDRPGQTDAGSARSN